MGVPCPRVPHQIPPSHPHSHSLESGLITSCKEVRDHLQAGLPGSQPQPRVVCHKLCSGHSPMIQPSVAPQYFHLPEFPFSVWCSGLSIPSALQTVSSCCPALQSEIRPQLSPIVTVPASSQFTPPGCPFQPCRSICKAAEVPESLPCPWIHTAPFYNSYILWVPCTLRLDTWLPASASPHKGRQEMFKGRAFPRLPLIAGYTSCRSHFGASTLSRETAGTLIPWLIPLMKAQEVLPPSLFFLCSLFSLLLSCLYSQRPLALLLHLWCPRCPFPVQAGGPSPTCAGAAALPLPRAPGLLHSTWPGPPSSPLSLHGWVLWRTHGGRPSPAHMCSGGPSAWLTFNRFQPESSCVSPVCLAAARQAPCSAPACPGWRSTQTTSCPWQPFTLH